LDFSAGNNTYSLNDNLRSIEHKQCAGVQFYLLAMAQRLDVC
jgi:hypothetical protein